MNINNNGEISAEALKVFETLPGLYLVLSKELTILTASNAYLKTTGKNSIAVTGQSAFEHFPLDIADRKQENTEALQKVMTTLRPLELPAFRSNQQESINYWQTTYTPVLNNSGALNYVIQHTLNVTQQVCAEQQLELTEQREKNILSQNKQLSNRLEKFMSEIPAQIAIVSGPEMVYEFVNKYYQDQLFPGRTLIGQPLLKAVPEIEGQPIEQVFRHVYKTGRTVEGKEMYIPLKSAEDGRMYDHYFNLIHQARLDEKGDVNGVFTFAYDITELVKARKVVEQNEQQLRQLNNNLAEANEEVQASIEELITTNEDLYQAQEKLRKLNGELEERVALRTNQALTAQAESESQRSRLNRFFMQAPAGICILDGPNLVFELINPLYQQLFPERKLLGKPLLEALPEIKNQPVWEILQNVYRTGKTFEGNELLVPLARYDNGPVEDRYFNFVYQARLDAQGRVDGLMVFVFEVTESVIAKRLAEQSEIRFQFMLDAMPQQVWTADPHGALNYVNQVICNDFGRSTEDVVGLGWKNFVHEDDLPGSLQTWETALQSGKDYAVEFRLLMHNGDYQWYLGKAVPLIENGKIKLWIGTNTNIDFQKTNEQKKDEFLSIASHELKTPLTSIKAFNQLMQRNNDAMKLQSFVKKSSEHILRLERLINDLLDVTKINAGKMHYNFQPFNFGEMLAGSVESVQHTSPSHRIIIKNQLDLTYTGDRYRIEQVINNFLTNAVKYSPEGKTVIVNCEIQLDNILVSVQDFGIGIANHDLNHLFDRYYRVDNTAMKFDGLGLGLFISSEILKRHHGSFWIESELERGSTFYFRLPLTTVKESTPVIDQNKFYKDDSITLFYNEAKQRLDVDWTGFQDLESVQNGGMLMLNMLKANEVHEIINDNTHVLGTWSDASDWAGTEWLPMMEKAGLKYFAWIYSPSAFSKLSAQKSVDVSVGNITIQFFTDYALAEEWMSSQP
jgi:PAS domain S-box-containing protein